MFADMEELGMRPDMQTVHWVARTYESLGLLKRKELVIQKYPPPTMEFKRVKGGRLIGLQVFKQKEGDNFLQESPTDEDMEDNNESDHDWSDGEQKVVISVFPHVISVPILITFYPLLRC